MSAALEIVEAAGLVPLGKPEDRLGLKLDDLGNAQRLRRAYGPNLVYVIGRGWGGWTGTHWDFEGGGHLARRMAARLQDLVAAEAAAQARAPVDDVTAQRELAAAREKAKQLNLDMPDDLEAMKGKIAKGRAGQLRGWTSKCGARAKIRNALDLLEPDMVEPLARLDADPWRLACPNGTLDLARAVGEPPPEVPAAQRQAWRERWHEEHEAEEPEERVARLRGCLTPPDRELRATRTLGVPFDPAATCPAFDRFLALIQPDPTVRGFLLRSVSLTLFGRNDQQVALLLRGAGGNGKSTLVQLLGHVLGGYGVPARIAMFLHQDVEKPGQASPEEIPLIGARAIFASEPKARDRLGADRIKAFTGGDRRMVRALNQPPVEYVPSGVPILQFNRTPEIPDEDEGTWRRLVFIPFDVNLRQLPPDQQRNMEEVLAELRAEGPGILNRLVEAFAEVRRAGLQPPQRAVEMKEELRAASDPVGQFIESCCAFEEELTQPASHYVQSKAFTECFVAWCEANGFKPMAPQTVRKQLLEKGYRKQTVEGRTYYLGLSVVRDMRQTGEGGAAE